GIGVEFNIIKDTIRVINPIEGGPSEKIGIRAGDRLIKVEGKNVAGVKITNKEVFEKLSLLDPSKSAYFAVRIKELKEN
ncbi:MAG: PDZ domain-containing protein, partial [Sphingobacteriales bacterium]